MFEETNNNSFHTDRVYGRFKVILIQCTSDGTDLTVDAATSSPGITKAAAGGVTPAFSGLSKGSTYWIQAPMAMGGATTVTGRASAFDASAGTMTLTLSAVPANGARLSIVVLVNRTG